MNDTSTTPASTSRAPGASHLDLMHSQDTQNTQNTQNSQDRPDVDAVDEVRHEGEQSSRDLGRGRTLRDQHQRRISAGRWSSTSAQSDPSYYLG